LTEASSPPPHVVPSVPFPIHLVDPGKVESCDDPTALWDLQINATNFDWLYSKSADVAL
jgi:hypothetical protein